MHPILFESLGAHLRDFGCHFGPNWISKGVHKFRFLVDSNKMRKNAVLDRVLKKHEFQLILDAKMGRPKLFKKEVFALYMLQFKRFGWLLRNLIKNGCPNGFEKSSKSNHLAPMVKFFEIL